MVLNVGNNKACSQQIKREQNRNGNRTKIRKLKVEKTNSEKQNARENASLEPNVPTNIKGISGIKVALTYKILQIMRSVYFVIYEMRKMQPVSVKASCRNLLQLHLSYQHSQRTSILSFTPLVVKYFRVNVRTLEIIRVMLRLHVFLFSKCALEFPREFSQNWLYCQKLKTAQSLAS